MQPCSYCNFKHTGSASITTISFNYKVSRSKLYGSKKRVYKPTELYIPMSKVYYTYVCLLQIVVFLIVYIKREQTINLKNQASVVERNSIFWPLGAKSDSVELLLYCLRKMETIAGMTYFNFLNLLMVGYCKRILQLNHCQSFTEETNLFAMICLLWFIRSPYYFMWGKEHIQNKETKKEALNYIREIQLRH